MPGWRRAERGGGIFVSSCCLGAAARRRAGGAGGGRGEVERTSSAARSSGGGRSPFLISATTPAAWLGRRHNSQQGGRRRPGRRAAARRGRGSNTQQSRGGRGWDSPLSRASLVGSSLTVLCCRRSLIPTTYMMRSQQPLPAAWCQRRRLPRQQHCRRSSSATIMMIDRFPRCLPAPAAGRRRPAWGC